MIIIPALFIAFFTMTSFNSGALTVSKIPTDKVQHIEGKRIYTSTCIKCHNKDPHIKGSIGPDLFTTPREVFHTKVITGTYPKGYTPKRKTRVMPKFKQLTNDVDKIYDYIQSLKKNK